MGSKLTTDRKVVGGLLFLTFIPAAAGTSRLIELFGGAEVTSDNARFFDAPFPVVVHIITATLYAALGAFQFAPGFRRTHRQLHRAFGRVLIPSALLVTVTGLWMTHYYPWPESDGIVLYGIRLVVGTAMLTFIALSIRSLRQRQFQTHGDWMLRAYALGMGAGTQPFTHLPYLALVGVPGETARWMLMGAGWLINAVVAELVIGRQRAAKTTRHQHAVPRARSTANAPSNHSPISASS